MCRSADFWPHLSNWTTVDKEEPATQRAQLCLREKAWPFFRCASRLILNPALLDTSQNTGKFPGTAHPGNTGLAGSLTGLLWLFQFGLSLLWPRDCSETVEISTLRSGLSQNHCFVSLWVWAGRWASYYFTNLWIRKSSLGPSTSR